MDVLLEINIHNYDCSVESLSNEQESITRPNSSISREQLSALRENLSSTGSPSLNEGNRHKPLREWTAIEIETAYNFLNEGIKKGTEETILHEKLNELKSKEAEPLEQYIIKNEYTNKYEYTDLGNKIVAANNSSLQLHATIMALSTFFAPFTGGLTLLGGGYSAAKIGQHLHQQQPNEEQKNMFRSLLEGSSLLNQKSQSNNFGKYSTF